MFTMISILSYFRESKTREAIIDNIVSQPTLSIKHVIHLNKNSSGGACPNFDGFSFNVLISIGFKMNFGFILKRLDCNSHLNAVYEQYFYLLVAKKKSFNEEKYIKEQHLPKGIQFTMKFLEQTDLSLSCTALNGICAC
ncbi:hypothetical protein CDIK_3486 [Cucumispora dikerogammari]|nr:hypothetical protein CDIK_3486 [Cucumispora dikerogammari]